MCSQSHGCAVQRRCPATLPHLAACCRPARFLGACLPHTNTCRNRSCHSNADPPSVARKPPVQKAWSQGSSNPITQRPSNPTPSNGVANPTKPSTAVSGETATPMRHLSDRMMYLLANLTVSGRGNNHSQNLTDFHPRACREPSRSRTAQSTRVCSQALR
jgi:predicted CxxxxCH...CXXCH cytochrome family protein